MVKGDYSDKEVFCILSHLGLVFKTHMGLLLKAHMGLFLNALFAPCLKGGIALSQTFYCWSAHISLRGSSTVQILSR